MMPSSVHAAGGGGGRVGGERGRIEGVGGSKDREK